MSHVFKVVRFPEVAIEPPPIAQLDRQIVVRLLLVPGNSSGGNRAACDTLENVTRDAALDERFPENEVRRLFKILKRRPWQELPFRRFLPGCGKRSVGRRQVARMTPDGRVIEQNLSTPRNALVTINYAASPVVGQPEPTRKRAVAKTAFANANEVKPLSPHHRHVIALHSPDGVAETGLCVKTWSSTISPLCLATRANRYCWATFTYLSTLTWSSVAFCLDMMACDDVGQDTTASKTRCMCKGRTPILFELQVPTLFQ
jgi:hypothetical protein